MIQHHHISLGLARTGNNVFFGTHARLAPQDNDESGDLYDARIDGGFNVLSNTGPCEGNTCQNPSPTPIDATPGTLTFIEPAEINEKKPATTRNKKILTNAEKLKNAIKACKKKPRARRKKCEAEAHKHYPTKTKKTKKALALDTPQAGRAANEARKLSTSTHHMSIPSTPEPSRPAR